MAEIVHFPTDDKMVADPIKDTANDRFLLDEGLDLLADFRLIGDDEVRASVRKLVKSLSAALRADTAAGG